MPEETQPRDVSAYLDHLRRGLRTRRRWGRLLAWSVGAAVVLLVGGFSVVLVAEEAEVLLVLLLRTPYGQACALVVAALVYLAARRAAASREARLAARELALRDDVRLVPDLLDGWATGGPDTARVCREGLLRLLAAVAASDADLLDERRRVVLREVLCSRDESLPSPC